MRYMFVCISSEAKSVHPMLKPYLWGTSHLFAPAECFLVSFPRNLRSASLIEYHNFLHLHSPFFRGFLFPLYFRYPFLLKNQHTQSFLLILCADFYCSLLTKWHWRLGTGFLSTPFILDVLADMDENHVSGGGIHRCQGVRRQKGLW